jgi:hypothetical protein
VTGGTAANPPGLSSSNYNDLYATGTDGVVGLFNSTIQTTLADWRTATGQDANSISVDPQFINPNGNAATGDLHISSFSPCVGAGLTLVTRKKCCRALRLPNGVLSNLNQQPASEALALQWIA